MVNYNIYEICGNMLTDDTLREGLQTPGIAFTIDEKIRIAKVVREAGIKRALISYPPAHVSEIEVTRKIVSENIFSEPFALGRATREDIDRIDETGANISLHLPFKLENLPDVIDAIKYASKKGKILEVAVVDVMKNDIREVIKIAKLVSQAGADIIQLPDTTGSGTPRRIRNLFSEARKSLDCEIEAHCHNDMGGATANAYAAIEGGADHLDTTIYGIGERNGITDTASIHSLLESEGITTGIDVNALKRAYELILKFLLDKIGKDFFILNFPVIGSNISTNTAGTHVAYSGVFTGTKMSLNVYAGKSMIKRVLENSNLEVNEEVIRKVLQEVKDLSSQTGKCVTSDQIIKMVGEFNGKSN